MHLVGVHVGRGAAAGLEDVDDELVVVLAVDDLLGRLLDGPGHVRRAPGPALGSPRRLALDRATAAMNRFGSVSPETGKLRRARSVWAP